MLNIFIVQVHIPTHSKSCGDALVAAILIFGVSAWKNAMGASNRCAASIDSAQWQNDDQSPERNPFRMPHGASS